MPTCRHRAGRCVLSVDQSWVHSVQVTSVHSVLPLEIAHMSLVLLASLCFAFQSASRVHGDPDAILGREADAAADLQHLLTRQQAQRDVLVQPYQRDLRAKCVNS